LSKKKPEPTAEATEEPTAGDTVEVGTLIPNQQFKLDGIIYTVSAVYPFAVMAVPVDPDPSKRAVEKLPLDTLVTL